MRRAASGTRVGVTVAVLLAVFSSLVAGAAVAQQPGGRLVPDSGAYWGERIAYSKTLTQAQQRAQITNREQALGRTLGINQHFYQWTEAFPTHMEQADKQAGRISLISWNTPVVTEITAGRHDALIAQRADDVRAFGDAVFLRWFWEMDADASIDRAVSPAAFIAAWKHIREIFAARGATNAVWVWAPTSWGFDVGKAIQWYPGDAEVDWIGVSGFNWAPGQTNARWRSFESVFTTFYDWAQHRPKPLMVAAYGAQERNAGDRATWFREAQQALKTTFSRIRAVVYFNVNLKYDWRVLPTSDAWPAYKAFGADPFFNPGAPPTPSPSPEPSPSSSPEPSPSPSSAPSPDPSPSASPAPVALVAAGSIWRYRDSGTDPGASWKVAGYDDSTWKSGRAELGYGDRDEATVITKSTRAVTYFRRTFAVSDPATLSSLTVRLLRDDGAVVSINGTEVVRSNMPTGGIGNTTWSASTIDGAAEKVWHEFTVPASALTVGTNVIAVSVSNDRARSSDLSFNLALSAQ